MAKTKTDRLELRLDAQLRQKIEDLAQLQGVPASVVVRRAIRDTHRVAFPPGVAEAVVAKTPEVQPTSPARPSILDFHAALWGVPPTDLQRVLYDRFGLGYRAGTTQPQIDAVVTTLLHFARVWQDEIPFVLAPDAVHPAVTERVKAAYDRVRGTELAAPVTRVVKAMRLGLPSTWHPFPPRIWVALGIAVTDDVPTWLTKRLVTAEEPDAAGVRHG